MQGVVVDKYAAVRSEAESERPSAHGEARGQTPYRVSGGMRSVWKATSCAGCRDDMAWPAPTLPRWYQPSSIGTSPQSFSSAARPIARGTLARDTRVHEPVVSPRRRPRPLQTSKLVESRPDRSSQPARREKRRKAQREIAELTQE